jgi:HSP20 family molecular chaperone IbpA
MRNKVFLKYSIGVLLFIAGGATMYLVQKIWFKPKPSPNNLNQLIKNSNFKNDVDDFLEDQEDLFNHFKKFEKLHQQMVQSFEEDIKEPSIFNFWENKKLKNTYPIKEEIKKSEDKDFIYYEVAIQGLKQEKVNIQIEKDYIQISGQMEQKIEEKNKYSYFTSYFNRSFPIPPKVDSEKVQVEQKKDKLIIKFPKIKE